MASLRARVPDGLKVVKRRASAVVKTVTDRIAVRGIARELEASGPAVRSRPDTSARHVLILRYRNYGPDASRGEASEAFILQNPLVASGQATFDSFFWDVDYRGFPDGDRKLLSVCRTVQPDALLLSSYEPGNPLQPSVETLRVVRKAWGIPIVAFWWDTCWSGFWESIQPVMPLVDVHVVGDNPLLTFLEHVDAGASRRRFLGLWTCIDPSFFTNPRRSRDIDVAFLGQAAGYRSERLPFIERLHEEGIPLYSSLANRDAQPSHEMYVDVLQRTKIGLNFSHSVDHHQLKGRVFETMRCGALLLESDNAQTASCFTPMEDYVPFASPGDLADKIRYYLAHDAERLAIAARGEEKVHRLYNPDRYWSRIFDALEEMKALPL